MTHAAIKVVKRERPRVAKRRGWGEDASIEERSTAARSYPPEMKAAVRTTYVAEGLALALISLRYNISTRTLTTWRSQAAKKGDDWEAARAAHLLMSRAPEIFSAQTLNDFVGMSKSITTEVMNNKDMPTLDKVKACASLADSFAKFTSGFEKANPKISKLAVAQEVMEFMIAQVRDADEGAAQALLSMMESLGPKMVTRFG